ncbi:MAG TPA: aminoglycoside 3'-phosphotransferase [Acidimicrobiales bacterium]|nr:aminoglycoside 3'-phosphotransferase [Acidimicrobiales bacterium]
MLAGVPADGVTVPAAVVAVAAGRPLRPVWENQLGGLTFEIGSAEHRRFVKWAPHSSGLDLGAEVERLEWAERFVAVPHVLDRGADDEGSWFVTAPLPGINAVAERWKAEPERAARAIGEGLRHLHDTLPVDACPFSWTTDDRLRFVRAALGDGWHDPRRWHRDHQHLTPAAAVARLEDAPPVDRLVVCHGDACAPNTLIDDDGRCSGHVDLGTLGVGDRWADLAVATWSTEWNYGRDVERVLLDAYGVDPDPERTQYFRLLWDLGP